MSGWGVETVEGGVVRRAGAEGAPALWFAHALGDSGGAFLPLLSSRLSAAFELFAPDLPGAGLCPIQTRPVDLEALVEWLARAIRRRTPTVPMGVVSHSLGAAVAVRAVRRLHTPTLGVAAIRIGGAAPRPDRRSGRDLSDGVGSGPARHGRALRPLDRLQTESARFDATVPVVTICGSGGGRSETAARVLRERGFRDVRSLCGGTAAWRSLEATKGVSS